MDRQLDILALEPFYGGVRRNMLETLVRCSRHRWTLLTLPPRRIERRLAAAAHWFAEQLSRRSVGHTDVVFTSDALNLPDLHRLHPAIADQPSVVYFHSNQLPDLNRPEIDPALDLTNLSSATAATEIWFNSSYNARNFMTGLKQLVQMHKELQSRNPLDEITAKMRLVPPPVDINMVREISEATPVPRDPAAIFVDLREANIELINAALSILAGMKQQVNLLTVGPLGKLSDLYPRQNINASDLHGQIRALLAASVYVSAQIAAPFDEHAVRAMSLFCRPVMPHSGVYPDMVPMTLHDCCLYDMSPEALASQIREAVLLPAHYSLGELTSQLRHFDAITACRLIDDRLDALAKDRPPHHAPSVHRSTPRPITQVS